MIIEALLFLIFFYSYFKAYRRKKSSPNYLGKTVWITGASSGLGQYLAYQFNRLGAQIIISARNVNQLQRVKEKCYNPQTVSVIKMDMTQFDTVRQITQNIIEKLQRQNKKLDVVIENAGVSMRCQFKEYAFKNHLQMFDVNVNGPYFHIQCFLDHMIKHKSGQIVGITSVAGKLSTAYRSSYAGSKHALIGILDSLRTQFHPYGIGVTNIMPGYVKTNISKNAFGAEQGKKFDVTDKNIQNGMQPDVFARQAVQAIFMRQNELQISGSWLIPFGLFMRGMIPDLAFIGLLKNAKNQSKAIIGAKKEQ